MGIDKLAAVAATIALLTLTGYLALLRSMGDEPAVWFAAGLVLAVLLAGYGAVRAAPKRRPVLVVAGVTLMALGLLGIASIGFPVIGAGLLALIAGVRRAAPGPATT